METHDGRWFCEIFVQSLAAGINNGIGESWVWFKWESAVMH